MLFNASQQDDGRYKHLLQPIRDLAANWDIDIASELEEYLVRNLSE
jgi:condensin-2 complex subunit H2